MKMRDTAPASRRFLLSVCVLAIALWGALPEALSAAQTGLFSTDEETTNSQPVRAATDVVATITTPTTTTTAAATPAQPADWAQVFGTFIKGIGDVLNSFVGFLVRITQMIFGTLGDGTGTTTTTTTTTNNGSTTGDTGTTGTTGTGGTSTGTTGTTGTGTGTSTGTSTGTATDLSADTGELLNYKGGKMSPAAFVKMLAPAAIASMKKTGVPASVTLAQAAYETGWGKSTIGNAKNLFGIKALGGKKGPIAIGIVNASTVDGGKRHSQPFRAYKSWTDSVTDHGVFLQGPRYKPCMAAKGNPDEFARQLQKCGYCPEPSYPGALISIMNKYNLKQYDKQ